MIKVGIVGADTPDAGELLRILIFHPEVEVISLYAPSKSTQLLSSVHHGFIGERKMSFSDKITPSSLDAVFILDNSDISRQIMSRTEEWPELRIIDLSPARFRLWENSEFQYGLSEINRKAIVRGTKYCIIPSSVASLVLIALNPLGANLLLSEDLTIDIQAPKDVENEINVQDVSQEIALQLQNIQKSFNRKIILNVTSNESERLMKIKTVIRCPLSLGDVEKIYDNIYDDHNFTFTTLSPVSGNEVHGTHKCVVSFRKLQESFLEVEILGDCRLRGGAGDAVHILNLLFALHEKVGLQLKGSIFTPAPDHNPKFASWFA